MDGSRAVAPQWPTSPELLADGHRCPVCFREVRPPACPDCGFRFADDRAPAVLSLGRQIVRLETERRQLIGAIRLTAALDAQRAEAAAARTAAINSRWAEDAAARTTTVQTPASSSPSGIAGFPAPSASPSGIAASPAPAAPSTAVAPSAVPAPAPRRRLTVPVLLLIVGVSLVGVAAVFFLLLAWFVAGIEVRALIIGGITLAAMAAASWLRRRSLTATAEGIAVLGVVLLGLDAWAVRANDLFATGGIDAAIYAGSAALVVAVVCRAWAVLSKLRAPDLAAAVALPVGLGLLLSGVLDAPPVESLLAGLLGAAAGGLAHALPRPWSSARRGAEALPERVALAFIGVAALTAGAATAVIGGVGGAAIIWSAASVVVLGIAHAWLVRPRSGEERLPGAEALGPIAASVATIAATTVSWQLALQTGEPIFAVLIAPVAAVAIAVGLDILRTRIGRLTVAATTAAVVGGLSLVAVLLRDGFEATGVISQTWTLWRTDAFALPSSPVDLPLLGVATAAIIAALLFASPTLGRPVLRDIRPLVAVVVLVLGAARSGVPAVAVGVAIVAAVLTVVMLARTTARGGWIAAGALATVAAFLLATATPWLWFIAVAVVITLPIAQRMVLKATGDSGVAFALAPVLAATISAFIAPAPLSVVLLVESAAGGVAVGSAVALVQWVAVATLGAALLVPLDRVSRVAVAWAAEILIAFTLAATVVLAGPAWFAGSEADGVLQGHLGEPTAAIVRGGLLVAGVAATVVLRARLSRSVVLGAAALAAPTLAATAYAVLRATDATDAVWASLVLLATAVLVVLVAAWTGYVRSWGEDSGRLRIAAEIGAAVTALVAAADVAPQHAWAMWALAGLGFAAVAVTHGWAAAQMSAADDVFATRRPGVRLAAAPRRLILWPAVAAATLAWWSWLGDGTPGETFTVETASVPVGVALTVVAAALVWLRRRVEASVALAAGVTIGLGASAMTDWYGAPLRGTIVAIVAAAICLAFSAEPLRRVRPTAPVGAAVALLVLAVATMVRTDVGAPAEAAWLLLLVAVAFASALGHAGARPPRASSRAYAAVAPAVSMIVAALMVGLATEASAVAGISLGVLALIHVGSAWYDRTPFGPVSRWASLAAAAIVSSAAVAFGVFDEVEWATLPLAGLILAGAAAAMLRSRRTGAAWPHIESIVWTIGLVIAVAPSILAPVEPVRVWLFLAATLAAAAAASVSPLPDEWRLRVPSALVLAGAALVMGGRALADPLLASGDAAAATAGVGAVAIAVVLASTAAATRTARHPTILAAAGAALLDAVVLLRFDGELVPAAIAVIAGGAVAIVGAATLGLLRWRGLGAVLALGGLVLVLATCAIRFAVVADQPGLEPDLWALAGAAVTVGLVLAALRAAPSRAMGFAGGAVLAATTVLFAIAEAVLLAVQDEFDGSRAVLAMSILSAAAVAGMLLRARLGSALAISAMVSAAFFGLLAIFGFGVTPVELVTVPPAVAGLGYGTWSLRRHPEARSWPLLGPWLVLLTIPSLLQDLGESDLWRVVSLGVVAIALVVVGAMRRLQAPLVLGSVVLVTHAVAQLWPWISAVYVAVPWWLWLGIGGAVLIFLAATYERRMRQMRTAFVTVAHLR